MKITIICPVRSGTPEDVSVWVQEKEAQGHQCYFPPRDTNQNDPTGMSICSAMRTQIEKADEVHVWYDPSSQGCHFDLGIAFTYGKRTRLINDPHTPPGKSYINVIRHMETWVTPPQEER